VKIKLPASVFQKYVYDIHVRRLRELLGSGVGNFEVIA
jgi:hypothetical protein